MRYLFVFVCLVLVIAAGCWASNNLASDDSEDRYSDQVLEKSERAPQEPESGVPELEPPLATVDGEHFEAFDLLRNRPLAHRITYAAEGQSFWIDASEPDFVRYIQGNHTNDWTPFAEVEDGVVAGTRGREAKLTMPAGVDGKTEVLEMNLFNPARGHNELTVTLNGVALPKATLTEGWQIVEISLEDAAVRADNEVALSFSNMGRIGGRLSGGGLAWARMGPSVAKEEPVVAVEESEDDQELERGGQGSDEESQEQVEVGGTGGDSGERATEEEEEKEEEPVVEVAPSPNKIWSGQGAFTLSGDEGLSWVVWLHDDAVLELDMQGEPGCGAAVELALERGQGVVETVLAEERTLVEGRGGRQTTAVQFDVESSQVARLNLGLAGDECEEITFEKARLIRPGTVAGVPEEITPPKYVLFWIIDTLRADYLPIHFETDVQAPNLKRLAEEGVSFRVAYVQGTESRASHASLFTGLYPERHGVMARGRVDPNMPILPHLFKDLGFQTGLYASNGYVSHLLNLNRGWDSYKNTIHDATAVDARALLRHGTRFIEAQEEGHPFFLYLGTIDPHVTYRRHDGIIDIYEPDGYSGRFSRFLSGEDLGRIKGRHLSVTDREKEWIINLYKNEITFNDKKFGMLRELLEEKGIWDETLVVVTSDHGEEFWEHGSVGHGHNVHQEMVHVPLIFHYPGGLPAGRVVNSGADVIDVLPTVRELVGGEGFDDRQGMNLLPTIFGEHGGYPAPTVATQYMRHYGMQIMDWKIYLRGGGFRIYDRREDILEMEDVREHHPLASRMLQDSVGLFRAYRREWDKSRWGVANNISAEFLELVEQ